MKETPPKGWFEMESAPKDEEVLITYDPNGIKDICYAHWSERPVCMLGPINGGFRPGWATTSTDNESNLPLDPPLYWKPYEKPPKEIK